MNSSPALPTSELSPATSAFLDFLRLGTALTVFGIHCHHLWFGASEDALRIAHLAVIVFFVLSGYVIAYSTFRKKRGLGDFAVARLSRLYSVVVPALVLTLLLDFLGQSLNPGFYSPYTAHGHEVLRYFCSAFFLQSIWCYHLSPSTNSPFWSLGYEFWYYVLFGICFLLESPKIKIVLLVIIALLLGTGILLLLPCWLIGVGLYFCRHRALSFVWALPGFVLSLLLATWALTALPSLPMVAGLQPLLFSNAFISDTLFAIALAATIWFFNQAFCSLVLPSRLADAIRFFADHTFSLYLYHFPLLIFARALLPLERFSPWEITGLVSLILFIIFLLSVMTEAKRPLWARLFNWIRRQIPLNWSLRAQ